MNHTDINVEWNKRKVPAQPAEEGYDTIYSATVDIPLRFELMEQRGRRFRMTLTDKQGRTVVVNIHHPEQLYMHGDDSVLAVAVTKEKREPGKIKRLLQRMIKNRPIPTTGIQEI